MARKLNLENVQTERVFNTVEQSTGQKGQQDTAGPEEIKRRRSTLKTQGRKGCRAVRINMAFTPENHRFIKVYARSTGQTMTEACNQMLEFARSNPKFLDHARHELESLITEFEEDPENSTGQQEDE